ncbi:GD15642 [Drosophila simulans]|uniref:GD15642 n=1 Tax=Drosophila simulans TaxID=7240 RepID=B4R6Y9_DROSI|nr:GD15642 [Drosophila simulans]
MHNNNNLSNGNCAGTLNATGCSRIGDSPAASGSGSGSNSGMSQTAVTDTKMPPGDGATAATSKAALWWPLQQPHHASTERSCGTVQIQQRIDDDLLKMQAVPPSREGAWLGNESRGRQLNDEVQNEITMATAVGLPQMRTHLALGKVKSPGAAGNLPGSQWVGGFSEKPEVASYQQSSGTEAICSQTQAVQCT